MYVFESGQQGRAAGGGSAYPAFHDLIAWGRDSDYAVILFMPN